MQARVCSRPSQSVQSLQASRDLASFCGELPARWNRFVKRRPATSLEAARQNDHDNEQENAISQACGLRFFGLLLSVPVPAGSLYSRLPVHHEGSDFGIFSDNVSMLRALCLLLVCFLGCSPRSERPVGFGILRPALCGRAAMTDAQQPAPRHSDTATGRGSCLIPSQFNCPCPNDHDTRTRKDCSKHRDL